MRLRTQRRLAAEILKVGENRIWMDPSRTEEISLAISKEDIKKLIKKRFIRAKPERGTSRGRLQRRKRGPGSREGPSEREKLRWMRKVRALRKMLKELRDKKVLDSSQYRKLYRMVKGGYFRDRGHLTLYLKKEGVLK